MVFEVRKGRECSATLTASLERITALENLTHSQAGLIELRAKEVAALKDLDYNWSLRLDNTNKAFLIEKSELKQKVRRKNKVILAESGLIGLLVLILLL